MNITEFRCPNCGATLTLSPLQTQGTCEYCGSKYHIDKYGEPGKEPEKTYTEEVQERLAKEKAERAAQPQVEDPNAETWEKVGKIALGALTGASLLGSSWRRFKRRVVNFLFSLLFFIVSAAAGYAGMLYLLPEAYRMYALVGAAVLSLCGLILVFSTRRRNRTILLGLGLGALGYLIPILFL